METGVHENSKMMTEDNMISVIKVVSVIIVISINTYDINTSMTIPLSHQIL